MEEIDALGFIRNRERFEKYKLREEYFQSESSREVFRLLRKFFKKYPEKKVASKKNLKLLVDAEGDEKKILYETIRALPTRMDEDIGNEKILSFIQQSIAKTVIRENLPALEGKGNIDLSLLTEGVKKINSLNPVVSTPRSYASDIEVFRKSYLPNERIFKTGIASLDEVLRIPPMAGEEWIVVGPPGRGKTQTLLNVLFRAAEQGHTCLYITAGDQGHARVVHRLNSIVSGISWKRLADPTTRSAGFLRKRVRENLISKGGEIDIQDFSDTSCCPSDIDFLLSQKEYDVVGVDYPDIMFPDSSNRYKERRHEIASIFTALRRIAVRQNVLIWCGSQANRSALDKMKITMKDVAEDIQKCWVADGIITFCQTEEEKEEGMGRFFIAKARRPPLENYMVDIFVDPDNGRLS